MSSTDFDTVNAWLMPSMLGTTGSLHSQYERQLKGLCAYSRMHALYQVVLFIGFRPTTSSVYNGGKFVLKAIPVPKPTGSWWHPGESIGNRIQPCGLEGTKIGRSSVGRLYYYQVTGCIVSSSSFWKIPTRPMQEWVWRIAVCTWHCCSYYKGRSRPLISQLYIDIFNFGSRFLPTFSYDGASTLPVALTAAYVCLYNQPPKGLALVPPVSPEGKGKYAGNPIVILGGSSSVGQNGKSGNHLSEKSLLVTPTIQLSNLQNCLASRPSSLPRLSSTPGTSNPSVQRTSLIAIFPVLL